VIKFFLYLIILLSAITRMCESGFMSGVVCVSSGGMNEAVELA
jgi:hypothetical protein